MNPRVLLALLLTVSIFTHADETSRVSLSPDIQRGDIHNPQGLWPLLGVGLGTMTSGENVRSGGVPMHVKIMGSYYFADQPWIADLGLGLHNEFLTQKGGGSDQIVSLYSEVAARYQFTNKWQLGAIWNTLVDNPERYKSNNGDLVSFVGVQVLKEFVYDDKYLVRAGGRAMTDVGIGGQTINTFMAELQVSFGNSQRIAEAPKPEPIAPEPKPEPVAPHLDRRAVVTLTPEPGPVNFESDSVHVVSTSKPYLKRLASALANNRELFDRIEVVGHTDQRGTEPYNAKLSKNRARNVAQVLMAAGFKPTQIKTVGRGKAQPLTQATSPQALARNRRVELQFVGVKNQLALKNLIDSITR